MRKKSASKRRITPDPKYNDAVVARFINSVLKSGKKHRASTIVYDALSIVEERSKANGLDVLKKAMNNVKP
jgi:small subunit ribosomal protein S7